MSGSTGSPPGPTAVGLPCRQCREPIGADVAKWMEARGFCSNACESAYKTPRARVRQCGCDESRELQSRLMIAEGTLRGIRSFVATWAGDPAAAPLALDLVLNTASDALEEMNRK